jgi:hypothetical protein
MYYKLPYQLVNDGDVTELGEEFSEAIILLSVAKMNAEQNKKEDADFFKLYQDEINNLKSFYHFNFTIAFMFEQLIKNILAAGEQKNK